MVERGIVKWFNPRLEYGFLVVLDENGDYTEEELFFQYRHGRWVSTQTTVDGMPIFTDSIFDGIADNRRRLSKPHRNNLIIFIRAESERHPDKQCAAPWGYADHTMRVA